MAKTPGKQFEEDWKNSIPPDVFFYRLRDSTASYYKTEEEKKEDKNIRFQMTNDYDCIMFKSPKIYTLELKSYKSTSFNIKSLRKNQQKGLEKASKYENAVSGVVFNIRSIERTFFLSWADIKHYIDTDKQKSIRNQYIVDNGTEIIAWKKVKNYTYDIRGFINQMEGW